MTRKGEINKDGKTAHTKSIISGRYHSYNITNTQVLFRQIGFDSLECLTLSSGHINYMVDHSGLTCK